MLVKRMGRLQLVVVVVVVLLLAFHRTHPGRKQTLMALAIATVSATV